METERLVLRRAETRDADEIFHIRNCDYVLKYNCMPKLSIEKLREEVAKDMESNDVFYIELKDIKKTIGVIDLDTDILRYKVNSWCISYYLGEEYSSKGYMTEALREMISYVFEKRQAEVLSVRVFKDNLASRRLVEKLGFVNEGCIRRCVKSYQGTIHDDMIYSILKEEYDTQLYRTNNM